MQHNATNIEQYNLYQQLRHDIETIDIAHLKITLAHLAECDVNNLTHKGHLSPLHLVMLAATSEHNKIKMTTLLLDYDFDINALASDPRIKEYDSDSKQLVTPLDLIFNDDNLSNLKKFIMQHNGVSIYQQFHERNLYQDHPGYSFIKKNDENITKQLQKFISKNHLTYKLVLASQNRKNAFDTIELVKIDDAHTDNPKICYRYLSHKNEMQEKMLDWNELTYTKDWHLFEKRVSRNLPYMLQHQEKFLPILLTHAKLADDLAEHLAQFLLSRAGEDDLKFMLNELILNVTEIAPILDIIKGKTSLFTDVKNQSSKQLKDVLTVKSLLLLAGEVTLVKKHFSDYPLFRDDAIMWFANSTSNLPDVLLYAIYLKQAEAVTYLLFEDGNHRHCMEHLFACALEKFDYRVINTLIDYCIKYNINLNLKAESLAYFENNKQNHHLEYVMSLFALKKQNYSFLESEEHFEHELRHLNKDHAALILKMTHVDLGKCDDDNNHYLHSMACHVTDDTKDLLKDILAYIFMRVAHPMLYLDQVSQNDDANLLNRVNHDKKNVAQLLAENKNISLPVKQELLLTLLKLSAHMSHEIHTQFLMTECDPHDLLQQQLDQLTKQTRSLIKDNSKIKKDVLAIKADLVIATNKMQQASKLNERSCVTPQKVPKEIQLSSSFAFFANTNEVKQKKVSSLKPLMKK